MSEYDQPSTAPMQPYEETTSAAAVPSTAPALSPPRWRGRKTAVAAALAIGLSSVGAVAAATTLEQGSSGDGGSPGRGQGFPGGEFPQQNQAPSQGQGQNPSQQGAPQSGQQAPQQPQQGDGSPDPMS